MRFVGMAMASGYPIEIPILIRSLAACMLGPEPSGYLPLEFDFKVLQALDAGTAIGDPSALVDSYAHAWWLSMSPPSGDKVLGSDTLEECLGTHRKFIKYTPTTTTFEKPTYTWGRGLSKPSAEGSGCEKCRPMKAILTSACDELRQLRLMVDGLETHFDSERQQSNRRAGGAHALFTSAEMKAMEAGQFPTDAETGLGQQVPSATLSLVPGGIRKPKKGPEVVRRVRQAAKEELLEFQSRPNMKWTWGVNLDLKDLEDLMGSKYNEQLEGSHSGYDSDLPDGSVTGSDSPAPGPMHSLPNFDELSKDVIDPPNLLPADIPHLFQHHPLGGTGVPGSALAHMVEQRKIKAEKRRQMKSKVAMPLHMRPKTPDLEITTFTVAAPSAELGTPFMTPIRREAATYGVRRPKRDPPIHELPSRLPEQASAASNISSLESIVSDIDNITLPVLPPHVPVYYQTPATVTDRDHPATSDISPELQDLPYSPTTQYINRRRRINIFLDDEMDIDIPHAGRPAIDVHSMADAWRSSEEPPASYQPTGLSTPTYWPRLGRLRQRA